jgi:hypothetical protein
MDEILRPRQQNRFANARQANKFYCVERLDAVVSEELPIVYAFQKEDR